MTARDLCESEWEVLEMLEGTRAPTWGAWVGACLERLSAVGFCTRGRRYNITPAGQVALRDRRENQHA